MEPFGLLQFLQSLLNTPPAEQENTPLTSEKNDTFSSHAEPPPSPAEPKNNDTYMQFISSHESRVKKTRK